MTNNIFVTVPSTNTYAMQHKLPHNAVVISPTQSGGKGRNGRSFLSLIGGAYFSVVRLDNIPVAQCVRYMLAAPLAVVDALAGYGVQAQIKWPNDVLISGAKVCGILVETLWQADVVRKAVVGIGVNVNNSLQGVECNAVNLCSVVGRPLAVQPIIDAVCAALDTYLRLSVAQLVSIIRPKLITLGKQVNTPLGQGVALDINTDGSLSVAIEGTTVSIAAGDVILMEELC